METKLKDSIDSTKSKQLPMSPTSVTRDDHQLQLLIAALVTANGNKQWRLHQPITVRLSPLDYDLLEIHGLSVSPKGDLYLMTLTDGHGYDVEQWDILESGDVNADKLIEAVSAFVFKSLKVGEDVI